MIGHVVIVAAHEGYRAAARRYFESRGASVTDFGDGGEATRYLNGQAAGVDAVITDLNLPTLDGITLVKLARLRYPSVAIAVVTGLRDPRLAEYLSRIGAAEIFSRSAPLEEIYEGLVQRVGSGDGQRRAAGDRF